MTHNKKQSTACNYYLDTMVCIRQATVHDLLQMQTTNLWCLPENYQVSEGSLSDQDIDNGCTPEGPEASSHDFLHYFLFVFIIIIIIIIT